MNKNSTLIIMAILLFVLGTYMIYLGTRGNILPPTITGLGFFIIGVALLSLRNK